METFKKNDLDNIPKNEMAWKSEDITATDLLLWRYLKSKILTIFQKILEFMVNIVFNSKFFFFTIRLPKYGAEINRAMEC